MRLCSGAEHLLGQPGDQFIHGGVRLRADQQPALRQSLAVPAAPAALGCRVLRQRPSWGCAGGRVLQQGRRDGDDGVRLARPRRTLRNACAQVFTVCTDDKSKVDIKMAMSQHNDSCSTTPKSRAV